MIFDDDETLPIPRRSIADRYPLRTHHFVSDHDDSPHEQRLSRCPLNNSISLDNATDDSIHTPIQLLALYEKTIELAAKNKINAKNAFDIGLVERLPEIMDVVAFDDRIDCSDHEPNFVKAGSVIDTSAKIYGYRVDALHMETQKLNGSIHQKAEGEDELSSIASDQSEPTKKMIQRSKPKASSYLVTDLSTISLAYEFDFHPFQPSSMCPWPGGVGYDTIYADMVSYTMYSSSDFPLVHGFINCNSRVNREFDENERILDLAMRTNYDLESLRDAIRDDQDCNHVLGCQPLREFSFNEDSTNSYIDTIDECSLIDSSLISVEDEPGMSNDVFSHMYSELRDDPSQFYFQELQSAHTYPTTMVSMERISVPSRVSFVDQIPHLLRDQTDPSDYNLYDATKLKLFAGPFLWKYTNLLPDSLPSRSIGEAQPSSICIPMKKTKALRSTRAFKIDLSKWKKTPSIEDLMNPEHWYRRKGSMKSRRKIVPIRRSLVSHARPTHLYQLRLARRSQPLAHLSSLHHFPDCNIELLSHPFEKYSLLHDDMHPLHIDDEDIPHGPPSPLLIEPMEYDFTRPVHYEKIEIDRNFSKIDAKKLQLQLSEEYKRQTNVSSTSPITLSNLLVELIDQGLISCEKDQLVSAFYCMLNNCHRNHLYLCNTTQRDDLFIQTELKINLTPITYTHTLNSQ